MVGLGSPFLGDFEGVDEDTGNLMFSLEANNLVDEDGNSKQTQAPYFESGWVDEEDLKKQGFGHYVDQLFLHNPILAPLRSCFDQLNQEFSTSI